MSNNVGKKKSYRQSFMHITAALGENAEVSNSVPVCVEGNGNRGLADSSLQRYLIGINITGMAL